MELNSVISTLVLAPLTFMPLSVSNLIGPPGMTRQLGDPCECPLSVEPPQNPEAPPAACSGTFDIDVIELDMADGHCSGGECGPAELLCHVDVYVEITGSMPATSLCRFSIYQGTTRIGGGQLGTGGSLDAEAPMDIGCDDFDEISIYLGAAEIEVHTYICEACTH